MQNLKWKKPKTKNQHNNKIQQNEYSSLSPLKQNQNSQDIDWEYISSRLPIDKTPEQQ